jgi:deoxyribonuclease-4
MLFGAHESVAGGLHTAFGRAAVDACRAVQIFTKNANQWKEPTLDDEKVAAFRDAHEASGALPVFSHTSYLINLATDKTDVLERSRDALVAEVERCGALGVAWCVLHPGAHLGAGDDVGLKRTAESLDEVLERTKKSKAGILIENTAGQGTCVGHRFEHLAAIFARTEAHARLGLCFDTQHVFAAGYDISTEAGYVKTFDELDDLVGLDRLRAFHINDSKKPLGARVDRHEHIGEGMLGIDTFRRLANDPRFADTPAMVETAPRDGDAPYKEEVALLVSLSKGASAKKGGKRR